MSHVDRMLKEGEDVLKQFKDREYAYREFIHKPVHIGQGILEQINSSYSKDYENE